jgi:hypothetical protein
MKRGVRSAERGTKHEGRGWRMEDGGWERGSSVAEAMEDGVRSAESNIQHSKLPTADQ